METNLGYVYYRKDSENLVVDRRAAADREIGYKAYGFSDEVWNRRVGEARGELNNFALYNAPPGTMQRMPVYFYLSPEDSRATQQAVMAFTHDDVYKPMPGMKVLVSHFISISTNSSRMPDDGLSADLATGISRPGNQSSDSGGFSFRLASNDTGATRLNEQKVYFDGCARFSDREFLLIPGEEPDANFGGHYMFLFPHPVFFTHLKQPAKSATDQPFFENGVYHTTTAANELELLNKEKGLVWQTHPRTKGSAGYPDAVKDKDFFQSDRFLGGSFQSLPVDQSEKRLCEQALPGPAGRYEQLGRAEIHDCRRRHLHEVSGR